MQLQQISEQAPNLKSFLKNIFKIFSKLSSSSVVNLVWNAVALIWRNYFLNYLSIFLKIEPFIISLLFNFVLFGAFPLQSLKYFHLFKSSFLKYFNKDWKSFSTSYSVMQLHPFGATPCPTSQGGISLQREMWKKNQKSFYCNIVQKV